MSEQPVRRIDEDELPGLWAAKKAEQLAEAEHRPARDRIIELYQWRALQLAREKKVPEQIELDDVTSWALFGLFDAVNKFDPDTSDGKYHRHFMSFASMRIRGAILDGLKSPQVSWASRQTWRRIKAQRAASEVLTQRLGRAPTREELAAELDVEVDELVELREIVPVGSTAYDDDESDRRGMSSWVAPDSTEGSVAVGLVANRVAEALAQLPEKHQETFTNIYVSPGAVSPNQRKDALRTLLVQLTEP